VKILDPELLKTFAAKTHCEWCGKFRPVCAHHWWAKGMGNSSQIDLPCNLVALCFECHAAVHQGNIDRASLLAVIAQREGMLQGEVLAVIHATLRRPKP
jgi:hypothetical protein